jgi:hypothetical protein
VIDSGSNPQTSGSILFDSQENQWIFVHQNAGVVTSSLLLMGAETYNNVGNETHPTTNRILKSVNDEHLGDSNISDTGTTVSINSNTQITGSFNINGSSHTIHNGYVILQQVSQSLNFVDDTAAAAGGVPLGGLYRNGNFIVIRIA